MADEDQMEMLPAEPSKPSHRELFLTGLLAQWAATDREPGVTPSPKEERRRAAEGARLALDQIRR